MAGLRGFLKLSSARIHDVEFSYNVILSGMGHISNPTQISAVPAELLDRIATFCDLGTLRPTCPLLSSMPAMRSRALSGLQKTLHSSRTRGHCYAQYAALSLRRRIPSGTEAYSSIVRRSLLRWMSYALIASLICFVGLQVDYSWISVIFHSLVLSLVCSSLPDEVREIQLLSALLDYQRNSSDERMLRVIGLLDTLPTMHFSGWLESDNDAEVRELNMLRADRSDRHSQHLLNDVAPLSDLPVAAFDKFLCTKASWIHSDSLTWLATVDFPGSPHEELRRILETARAGHGPPELTCIFQWLMWRVGRLVHLSCTTTSTSFTLTYMRGDQC